MAHLLFIDLHPFLLPWHGFPHLMKELVRRYASDRKVKSRLVTRMMLIVYTMSSVTPVRASRLINTRNPLKGGSLRRALGAGSSCDCSHIRSFGLVPGNCRICGFPLFH